MAPRWRSPASESVGAFPLMGKNAPDPSDLPIKVILKIWVSRSLVNSTIFDKVQKKSPV